MAPILDPVNFFFGFNPLRQLCEVDDIGDDDDDDDDNLLHH